MKYYIIAGEASGDLHGSNLMSNIVIKDSGADFRFWGGDKMSAVGGHMVKHYKDMAFMGFVEVIKNLSTILKYMSECKADISLYNPDILILIDYPGFNLRIAEWAKKRKIKVVYYIVPQVWAWHTSRVKKLRAYTDKLLVILPFEKEFFERHNCNVVFVGHPLLDEMEKSSREYDYKKEIKLALLPGSRKQEINAMLKIFLDTAKLLKMDCVIAGAQSIPVEFYEKIISQFEQKDFKITLVMGNTYQVLSKSQTAFVASGTATLETALFGVPQVVCYKGNPISYLIAKSLVKLKYISLVNLILEKPAVKELIQNALTSNELAKEYQQLNAEINRNALMKDYNELQKRLGGSGASERASVEIVNLLKP